MPTWIRCTAAIGIAAFVLSFAGGLLGADGWWQASGVVFTIAFVVVSAYKVRHEQAAAIDLREDVGETGDAGGTPIPPVERHDR